MRLGAVSKTRPSTPAPGRMPVPVPVSTAAPHSRAGSGRSRRLPIAPSAERRAKAAAAQQPTPQSSGVRSDAHSSRAHHRRHRLRRRSAGWLTRSRSARRRAACSAQRELARHAHGPDRGSTTQLTAAAKPVSSTPTSSEERAAARQRRDRSEHSSGSSSAGARACAEPARRCMGHPWGAPCRRPRPRNASTALDTGFVAKVELAALEGPPTDAPFASSRLRCSACPSQSRFSRPDLRLFDRGSVGAVWRAPERCLAPSSCCLRLRWLGAKCSAKPEFGFFFEGRHEQRKKCGNLPRRGSSKNGSEKAQARAFIAELTDRGFKRAKIGGFDIDGVLRGKYVSLDKLESALAKGLDSVT